MHFLEIFLIIFIKGSGFGELYSKVIFSKIVEGVKCIHDHNICNRDLKLENILLNADFCPKICDFGFARINIPDFKDHQEHLFINPQRLKQENLMMVKKLIFFV